MDLVCGDWMSELPRLRAYVLPDGHSFAVVDRIKQLVHELDAASGNHLDLVAIGDPSQSGAFSRRYRSTEEVAAAPVETARYVEGVYKEGRERSNVLEQSRIQARMLGVEEDRLPCIALGDRSNSKILAILAIEREWYESEPALQAFGRALELWLQSPELVTALENYDGGANAEIAVKAALLALGPAIRRAVVRATGNRPVPRGLEVPAGTILHLVRNTTVASYRGERFDLGRGSDQSQTVP
ncbi:MAG: hypothetical protein ABI960_11510 [Candidatus Eisenbacteria bacterium]